MEYEIETKGMLLMFDINAVKHRYRDYPYREIEVLNVEVFEVIGYSKSGHRVYHLDARSIAPDKLKILDRYCYDYVMANINTDSDLNAKFWGY